MAPPAWFRAGAPRLTAPDGGFFHESDLEVTTAQVAPTIVQALGLEPSALDAVRAEGTPVLPEVIGQIVNK